MDSNIICKIYIFFCNWIRLKIYRMGVCMNMSDAWVLTTRCPATANLFLLGSFGTRIRGIITRLSLEISPLYRTTGLVFVPLDHINSEGGSIRFSRLLFSRRFSKLEILGTSDDFTIVMVNLLTVRSNIH